MSEFIAFTLGGIFGVVLMCCLQINRINEYEAELRKLRSQLNNK